MRIIPIFYFFVIGYHVKQVATCSKKLKSFFKYLLCHIQLQHKTMTAQSLDDVMLELSLKAYLALMVLTLALGVKEMILFHNGTARHDLHPHRRIPNPIENTREVETRSQ